MEELKNLEDQIRELERKINRVQEDERKMISVEILQLHHKHKDLLKSMANEKFGESEKKMSDLPPGWDMKDFEKIEIPPEHKGSLGDTFKYLEDKIWEERLKERKKEYNASGRGIDFNKERTDEEENERTRKMYEAVRYKSGMSDYPPEYYKSVNYFRDADMKIPSKQSNVAYMDSSFGVDIEAEQIFQKELHGIVDDMKVKLVDEKKILEGTLNPEYGKGEWGLPHIDRENELSNSNPVEEQWKSDSQNGSLITDPTPTSTQDSSSSSSTAELFNRGCPIVRLRRQSTNSPTNSCSEKSDDCGIVIDATNESSECTVPMISALTLGTPNEARWSPRLRSMESSVPSLLDAKL